MKTISISVTDALRNFADCVNRVHYQKVIFMILKNGQPVARLVPDSEKTCLGRDLADALGKVSLSESEAKACRRDRAASRNVLKPPRSEWS